MPATVPLNVMAVVVAPLQYVAFATGLTVGVGFTVMVKVIAGPTHPFAVGVTVMVATTGAVPVLVAVNDGMFPAPLAAKPIEGVLLTQA